MVLGSNSAVVWEGSRSSALYFEFLFQKNPFTFFLFSWFCTQWTAGLISMFSISFPLVAPCLQPLWGCCFPPLPLLLDSWVFWTSFFVPLEETSYLLFPFSVWLLSVLLILSFFRRKKEIFKRWLLGFPWLQKQCFTVVKYWVGKQERFCLWSGDRWVYLEERAMGRAFRLLGSLPSTGICSYRQ